MKRISIYLMKPKLNYFLIFSFILAHSAGNKDIYKANRLNAHKGLITNYYLLSLGSPVSENPLRDSINAVGGEFVGQVNHPYDFIIQSVNWNTETSEPPYPNTFRSESNNFVTRYLENTHGYEMYLRNYGIKNIIENIMRENAMKENSEKELSNGKN
ncbi:hypothetical protein [Helicobacter apodemus]|uniref:Uncharacterized protein n=1 Tax=Helicobacter apodemus TaxID=135569 RepID=A0A2U8FBS6_9HELI|nr:hypothetical protein [Helicobacter apodemus]AWI33347.1 hypothetical protein CDV25_00195 [Helicobacter apodemus]